MASPSERRLFRIQPDWPRVISIVTRGLVCVIVLAISVAAFMALWMTRTEPALAPPERARPPVLVMQAEPVTVRRQWEGYGTARPAPGMAANIPAQVRGIIEHVPESSVAGERVAVGDLIVQLDDSDLRDEVEMTRQRIADVEAQLARLRVEMRNLTRRLELAQEEVKLAEEDLERVLRAREQDGAQQREVDQARQQVLNARQREVAVLEQIEQIEPREMQLQALGSQHEAALRVAEKNLERTRVRSPMDGVLQAVYVERGESIGADQPVARVVNLSRIEVPLRLPAAARAHVRVGDEVVLRPAGAGTETWNATVRRIAPEEDESTRTMMVFVEIEQNPDDANVLAPGKFVSGVVISGSPQQRYVVPRRSIQSERIRIVENGAVRSRLVQVDYRVREAFPELGVADEYWSVLHEPLPEGSLVVVDGARALIEGAPVEPVVARLDKDGNQRGLAARMDDSAGDVEAAP